ncbi:acyltransferase [Streptomyces sp. NPDC089799]|uniref:acyltransferase n=1 Tax=Streptomyces sp. NPDC089799 TaxID=3155066 RepID=UPI003426B704
MSFTTSSTAPWPPQGTQPHGGHPADGPGRHARHARPAGDQAREHRWDIDVLRIVCSVAVIAIHTAGYLLTAVKHDPDRGLASYWLGTGLDGLTRFAVPLFFAMAGWAVLVGSPPRSGAVLRKRLVRVFVPMAVWTVFYLVWAAFVDDTPGIAGLTRDALFGSIRPAYHLWYLYSYIPLILLLGLVALLRSSARPWGAAIVVLLLGAAPYALGDLSTATGWQLPAWKWQFAAYQAGYAVIGALLLSMPRLRGRLWWVAAVVLLTPAVAVYQDQVKFPVPYGSLLVAALSVAVLMSLLRIRVPERLRPWVSKLSTASFGAYLVHLVILRPVSDRLLSAGHGWAAAIGATLACILITSVVAFGLTMLWQKAKLERLLG